MKSIKQYADEKHISHQAVYQLLKSHEDELKDFIVTQGRTRFLTENAEAILEKYRKAQYIIEREDNSKEVDALKLRIENLLLQVADQATKIANLSEWKSDNAVAIAEANQRQLLLEEKTKKVEELEQQVSERQEVAVKEAARADAAEADLQDAAAEIEALKQALADKDKALKEEKGRKLTLGERFFGKKKGE